MLKRKKSTWMDFFNNRDKYEIDKNQFNEKDIEKLPDETLIKNSKKSYLAYLLFCVIVLACFIGWGIFNPLFWKVAYNADFVSLIFILFPSTLIAYFTYELFNNQPKLKISKKGITQRGADIYWEDIEEAILVIETRHRRGRIYLINLIDYKKRTLIQLNVGSLDLSPEYILFLIHSYLLLYKRGLT